MQRKVSLNNRQYISIEVFEEGGIYGYNVAVILNAFNQGGFSAYTFDDEEECYEEGHEAIKYIIQTNIEAAKFPLNDLDQELVVKLFDL